MAVKATPDAEDAVEQVDGLRDENAQLQEAVRSHAVVDQAIGVVIVLGRLTPDQGWRILREISHRTNTKLRQVAEQIVDWAGTGELPADIHKELQQQLNLVHTPHTHG